jgi:capsular polysaccharide biosynthesis protein
MTQVEVPQISLQRYFDLLKRRRWQVIPVSLLGLLVGGLIAFFIPRYYVADTMLVHQMVPGQIDPTSEDPMRSIVETAQLTIPLAVGETMRETLKWPEALAGDASQRTQYERGVAARLQVFDSNPKRDRDYAQIRVFYRDRDGGRAASFLNALVATWIDKRLRELREPAELERARANEAVKNIRGLYDRLAEEKRQLAVLYEIDPSKDLSFLRLTLQQEELRANNELRTACETKEGVVLTMRRQLENARELLANTQPRVLPDASELLDRAKKSPAGLKIMQQLEYFQEVLRGFHPGTDRHRQASLGVAEQEARLRALLGSSEVDADGMIPNPAFTELQARIVLREQELAVAEGEYAVLKGQLDAESERVVRRAAGFGEYERKLAQFEEARRDLERANEDLRKANDVLAGLGKKQTVQQVGLAQPPPRPTEPNILVIAMIGCVLGLGVAIALILLLDMLQGTFKTLDDVERAVPVPVLGGMSHLETEAERQDYVRRRRRVSLVSAAFVSLVVIVVTIFYVDPTRLPPVVRDLLAMLLGS